MASYDTCTEVTPQCPVEGTIYGYEPNAGANGFFVFVFAVCALAQVVLGWRHRKTWKGYSILVILCALGEAIGYIGRLMLNSNPWSDGSFILQYLLLIISPSFLAAALYMTLKGLVLHFGREHTRLPPKWWTWGFVTADMIGFILQIVGGVMSSGSDSDPKMADLGIAVTIVGISVQAATMGIAALLALNFARSVWRAHGAAVFAGESRGFKTFLIGMTIAFFAILARCIYRIPEMAGGYGKGLMREEVTFMIFDGALIATAVIIQTVIHPGIYAASARTLASENEGLKHGSRGSNDEEYGFQTLPAR